MVAIVLLPLIFQGQNNILYREVYNYKTQNKIENPVTTRIIATADKGKIYYTTRYLSEGKTKNIYCFDTTSRKTQVISIPLDKSNRKLFHSPVTCIEVVDDTIFLATDPHILVFTVRGKSAELAKSIKNTKFYFDIRKLNDRELFLYVNYNFHPLDASERHVWGKLNLHTLEITDTKVMGDENLPFSYYVNSWHSIYKGLIAYNHTFDYKIDLYNDQYVKTDSISSDLFKTNAEYSSLIQDDGSYSKDEIMKVGKMDDSLFTRIQKVYLLDSTHVLAVIKKPKTQALDLHLWEKQEIWKLKKTTTISGVWRVGQKYDDSNNQIEGFYGNMNGCAVMKNAIFFIGFPYMENIKTDSFEWDHDYNGPINEAIRSKELYYGIRKLYVPFN